MPRSLRRDESGAASMVRVVLDTNVVISAALKPSGNERAAFAAVQATGAILLVSPALLAEYEQVAARRKFRRIHAELDGVITAIRLSAHHVSPESVPRVSRDVADDMVLACAEAGAADYLVTGNLRDFPPTWRGTRVVNARAFLTALASSGN
jgi:uncharacterized protein